MLSNRPSRRLACLGLLALAGCGFAPIYGDGGAVRGIYAFETDETIIGFRMAGRFAERLGPTDAAQFTLRASVTTSQRAASITSGGDTSRLNVFGAARWALTDNTTGLEVEAGTVEAFTSYAATGSTVATQAAQDDARARLAVLLADMIVTRILAETSQ